LILFNTPNNYNYNPYLQGTNYGQIPYQAYNTSMPAQYSNNMQSAQPVSEQRMTNANFIPVNGIQQVREHIVQPNQVLYFMDNNRLAFYVKSADNFGTTQLKSYRFEEFNPDSEMQNISSDTVPEITRQELDDIKMRMDSYEKKLAELARPVSDYARKESKKNESTHANDARK